MILGRILSQAIVLLWLIYTILSGRSFATVGPLEIVMSQLEAKGDKEKGKSCFSKGRA